MWNRLKLNAMMEHRKLGPEPLQKDLDLLDRWFMDGLIPEEKQLTLLTRYETRLVRQLFLNLHELEAMQSRRRGQPAPLARLDIQGIAEVS